MANPQKENGYTAIANELMERIALLPISGSEFRILMVVLRKTYGFQKKEDVISLTQFQKLTGLKRANVCRTIKELVAKRLLLKGKKYRLNKNHDEWVVAKRLPSSQNDNRVVANRLHTKETITKESIGAYAQFTLDGTPMTNEWLNDGDVTYEPLDGKTPKKYKNKRKLYARIVIHYMKLTGKTGDVLRYFKDVKELVTLSEKLHRDEKEVEQEIMARIKVAAKYYAKNNIKLWSLGKIVENWDIILNDWSKEVE